ncbi:MAG: hypothetical protein RL040_129 [Bacteroidota bacterium]|jgi:hypothetical protein
MAGNYFIDGIMHITDVEGYDHMLFLLAMCAPFTFREWKPVAILATAFTVGHSVSLALAAFDVIRFSSEIIEFLIPVTILATSAFNWGARISNNVSVYRYASASIFGVIHGMGFSSFFRMISGEGEGFIEQLFLFNLGVEAGQLLILSVILSFIAISTLAIPSIKDKLPKILAGLSFLLALVLTIEKFPY